jgi:hypothetical protein
MTAKTRNLERQPFINRIMPILMRLPGYQRAWLRGDVLAGAKRHGSLV